MITTPSVPAAGTSGRAAPAVAPIKHIAEDAARHRAQHHDAQNHAAGAVKRSTQVETARAAAAAPAADQARRFIAERESAMRDRLSREAAEAANPEPFTVEIKSVGTGPEIRPVETIDLLPPPATEVLAKGGRQSRVEARAEMFEAEARMRVLDSAAAGYGASRSALG